LVRELVTLLESQGAGPARDLTVTEESVSFRLPGALAKDVEQSGRASELLSRYNRTTAAR
jgi:hypothetical protein